MRNVLVVTICLLHFLLFGCARQRFDVKVTTYLSPELQFATPQTDSIAVMARTVPDEPLLQKEVARKIETLLTQRGYVIKPVGEARFVLFAYFTIDNGTTVNGTYTAYVPGGTSYTNVYTNTGQTATATTTHPGRTEQRSYSYTFFTRYLGATLYDNARFVELPDERKSDAMVWRAITTSAGSSSDLRWTIDYLLVTAFELFGEDTGKQVSVTLFDWDARVKAMREAVGTSRSKQSE